MNIFPFHFTCGKIMIILALTEHKIPASLFLFCITTNVGEIYLNIFIHALYKK